MKSRLGLHAKLTRRQKRSGVSGRLEKDSKVGRDVSFPVRRRMTDFDKGNCFLQHDFVNRQCHGGNRERMVSIFERESLILIIVRHIGFVMHRQEFEKRHIFYLLPVLGIMLDQNRKTQRLVKLRVRVDVKNKKRYAQQTVHSYKDSEKFECPDETCC
jgi:hypothetical protein